MAKLSSKLRRHRIIMLGRAKRFIVSERASTAISFALIFPIFSLLLLAITEIAIYLFITVLLNGALITGARMGQTGAYANNKAAVIAKIQSLAGAFNNSNLQISIYASVLSPSSPVPITSFTQYPTTTSIDGPGGPGAIVSYGLSYEYTFLTPAVGSLFNAGSPWCVYYGLCNVSYIYINTLVRNEMNMASLN